MNKQSLETTARAMVARGKGILAMDESMPTIGKRLEAVGVDNTLENRIAYRSLLLGTPGLGEYISGAILFDETLRQTNEEGVRFTEVLRTRGMLIGIKVDAGTRELGGHPGEKVTEGLDGLRERLADYVSHGASFCKWRAVITIGPGLPSRACIAANAHALARYAALCQEIELVPIVEPEVLIDGDHSLSRCFEVTRETLHCVFEQLYRQDVAFSGMVLKPSMVIPGLASTQTVTVETVAEETLRCLADTVPAAVHGIAFLSGGQSDQAATAHLNAINRQAQPLSLPWPLTFSYARALQQAALAIWQGDPGKVGEARACLLHRARLNALASTGSYEAELESVQV